MNGSRQHLVRILRELTLPAAQLNLALHDGAHTLERVLSVSRTGSQPHRLDARARRATPRTAQPGQ